MLIADDDGAFRRALAAVVRGDPQLDLVGAAANADDVASLAVQARPDVVILDVRMPGGGSSAAREIARAVPGTGIVAMSSFADDTLVREMHDAGAGAYLLKGCSTAEIRAAVHEAFAAPARAPAPLAPVADRADDGPEPSVLRVIEDGLIDVAFQPVVGLLDAGVVGYEALARFPGSDRSPARWFEEAERLGLRERLEIQAVHRALEVSGGLGPDQYLSVNLSPDAATIDDLVVVLAAQPAGRVVVELNEQAPVRDHRRLGGALARLRAAGVGLALDDAGAGEASLNRLVRLGPDFVKLDGELSRGVDRDHARRAVAAGLISCASELEAAVVAKGVETQAQADQMRLLGAGFGQGFHFARPGALPASSAPPRERAASA